MRTTANIRNTRTARFRRHVTGAILVLFTVLLLATCNDLTLVETMSDLRLEQDNPVDPAWRDGYPAVDAGSIGYDSFSVEFALDTWAQVYYGVWPAGVVTDLPDNFCGELRAWAHDGSSTNTSTYADTMLKWGFFDVEDDVVSELISGLDQDTEYEVLAVADRTDQSGNVILQPLRGVWRSPVVTTGAVPWLSAADVDHLTLHISEPAILNGESARFVIRAENADGTVKTDATGMVRLFSTSAETEIDPIDEVCLLDGGIGYWDIPVTSLMTGQPFEAMFAVNNGDTDDLHDDDTLMVVDTTGFTDFAQLSVFEGLTGKYYLDGTANPNTIVRLSDSSAILVLKPDAVMQFSEIAMGFSIDAGSVFLLGAEDRPVQILGPTGGDWMGISVGTTGPVDVFMNGVVTTAPSNEPFIEMSGTSAHPINIHLANSRINAEPIPPMMFSAPNIIYLFGASSGPLLEMRNTVVASNITGTSTEPATPVILFESGSNEHVSMINNTIRVEALMNGGTLINWVDSPGTCVLSGNIIGGDYQYIASFSSTTGLTFDRNVFRFLHGTYWWDQLFYAATPASTNMVLNYADSTTYWPGWGSGISETFELGTGILPVTGDAAMIGSLTAGHPNEVGAYANFGYPPAP